mgnify:CR=1 FL=1
MGKPTGSISIDVVQPNKFAGQIAAFTGSGITSVQVSPNSPESWKTIWPAPGVPPTIPVGTVWKMRVSWMNQTTSGFWTASVTYVNVTTGAKEGKSVSYAVGPGSNDSADFAMGVMPSGNVALRVKLWMSNNVNAGNPPDSRATAW